MNFLTAAFLFKRVLHSIKRALLQFKRALLSFKRALLSFKRALMTYWCDTYHSYNLSLMNDDEVSDCHISIRKSPTFYQKSPTFIQKSPCILSREACAWHVELSVCNIFRRKSPTFWQKSPTFCQKSHTIYQKWPLPDMLNFLIATRGKRACICGSFGCWCCSMLQWGAVYCSVLQCEG